MITSRKIKSKRTQQEIVGFMIIILLVVVVGVIFLGIYLRQDTPIVTEDAEIMNFLSSSLRYTTECYKDYEGDYKTLGDLMKYCYTGTTITCPNSLNVCQTLAKDYTWMLGKLWNPGINRPVKYTKLSFFYQANISDYDSRTRFAENLYLGNSSGCSIVKSGSQSINIDSGNLMLELEICKGN